jgi:hypothetical protein
MLNITRLALLFCTLLLGACTITGPADDGYDNSNEWTDNGTLMSDDARTIYDSEEKKSSAAVEPGQASTPATTATTATTATSDKDEFEQFKEWNRLRGQGVESAEYQEFLQWQEFQKFKATQ